MIDSCKETMTLVAEEKRQHDRFAKRIIADEEEKACSKLKLALNKYELRLFAVKKRPCWEKCVLRMGIMKKKIIK